MAVLVGAVEGFVIRGEALIQPDLAPVFAGDEVPKPLMGQFMRDEPLAIADVLRRRSEQGAVGESGRAGVFHAARDKVIDTDLVILVPGIRDANLLFKELHHVFRVPE